MDHDWTALLWQQSVALAELIEATADADLDRASLCEG